MGKRALLYLRRKYKRSLLLLLLLLVISLSLAIGLSIYNSIDKVAKEVQQTLGTSFNVKLNKAAVNAGPLETYDWCNGMKAATYVGPEVDPEMVDKVMQIDGISRYNADSSAHVYADDFGLVEGAWARSLDRELAEPDGGNGLLSLEEYEMWARTTILYGNTDTRLYDKFRTGAFNLVEGRYVTPEDVRKALISEQLAEENGLQVGDTISVSSRIGTTIDAPDLLKLWGDAELEIVGIFHVNGYQPVGDFVHENEMTYNWILTDVATTNYFSQVWKDNLYVNFHRKEAYENITFFVDDPAKLNAALEQATQVIQDPDNHFDIAVDDTMFRSTVEPLRFIKTLVAVSVSIIVIGCMIVLAIVFTMWVKSRKREIAVYLSMGLSKASIIGQFILEAALVAAVACVLAAAVSRPAADAVGNALLASSIENAAPEQKQYTEEEINEAAKTPGAISELFAFQSGSYGGPEHIDFTFRAIDLLLLLLLEAAVILAAIAKAGTFIFKLQPRQILSTLS